MTDSFPPWPENEVARYTAYRAADPIAIDGHLDEPSWLSAPRSPRFRDLIHGAPGIHDTRSAVLWDDQNLYVGFWVEEPFVTATLTERDAPIYENNDVEVFIAGQDAYYELEINALGTIYEVLRGEEAYQRDWLRQAWLDNPTPKGRSLSTALDSAIHGVCVADFFIGLPGLQWAVHVDGTLNDDSDRDRGWTVELAFPWKAMDVLARGDNRSLPPNEGDAWRMDFSRFNQYKEAPPRAIQAAGRGVHMAFGTHTCPSVFPLSNFSTPPCSTDRIPLRSVQET